MPKPDDRRVTAVRAAVPNDWRTPSAPLKPAAVAHLSQAVYPASDARYAQSRTFRNRLIRLTLISLGAIGLILAAFAVNAIPLPIKGIAATGPVPADRRRYAAGCAQQRLKEVLERGALAR